ncbi:MAG: alpha/beta fold hydrolase [Bacteroidales bacterium]|nr:alpha/beta fold hydrolase [Bacteroidales bacterium]
MKKIKWLKKNLLGILLLIISLLIIGFTFERISRFKAEKITPHGKFVDVGGHKLHYYKKGTEGPTIIFESAFDPAAHLQWFVLQQEISKFATTLSYDRAGLLWSERGNNPKTGEAMAEELHALLEKANVSKPYILVGHSLGGIILRSYISKYPQDVAGVILIDSACPNEEDYLSDELYEMVSRGLPGGFLKFANSVGLVRQMFKGMFPDREEYNYLNTLMPTLLYKSAYAVLEEQDQMPLLHKEANKITSFGNIPLLVLTASDRDNFDHLFSDEKMKNEFVDAKVKMQKDFLKLSSDSEQILVPNSSHYINEDQPEVIISAVQSMILKTKI